DDWRGAGSRAGDGDESVPLEFCAISGVIMKRLAILVFVLCCGSVFGAPPAKITTLEKSVWISREEIMLLPTTGPAWNKILSDAGQSVDGLDLKNQEDNKDQFLRAKAMVGVRTNNEGMLVTVRAAVMRAMETENGGRTLALGRNLASVVIAADLA